MNTKQEDLYMIQKYAAKDLILFENNVSKSMIENNLNNQDIYDLLKDPSTTMMALPSSDKKTKIRYWFENDGLQVVIDKPNTRLLDYKIVSIVCSNTVHLKKQLSLIKDSLLALKGLSPFQYRKKSKLEKKILAALPRNKEEFQRFLYMLNFEEATMILNLKSRNFDGNGFDDTMDVVKERFYYQTGLKEVSKTIRKTNTNALPVLKMAR